ncbi:MAG: response regulator [Desulfarculus sp.]|nr:response regulator [Desulfarculus sp.]
MSQAEEAKPTVLVVDDVEANLDILSAALGQDYQVSAALDGRSALEAVLEAPPDLILLDIMMPVMDGYEVCRRLKADQRFNAIPIIFLTALTEVENKTKGLALGAVDYITKPFEIAEVRARVDTHLKLRQAQARLEHQNQLLKDYARLRDEVERMTRHDLKNPLSAVINVPAMLMEEPNLTDDQRTLLHMLQESGTRMLHLINSSLDLYKMEIGRYQLNPEAVESVRLVRQIWAEMRELIHAKRLELILLVAGRPAQANDTLWVSGEEMLIYSLLANLIKNALEASPPNEGITITMDEGPLNLVRIHNQGEVPKEVKDRFFAKFATAGKKGGTGLGTYTARLIAQTLGGAVAMASSAQRGTLLTVSLPPAQPEPGREAAPLPRIPEVPARSDGIQTVCLGQTSPDQPSPTPAPPGPGGEMGVGILVVDDYSNMRRLTKSALRRMGYNNLFEASHGQEALQVLAGQRIGLVISDVNMPIMNGVELLRAVRADPRQADLPFILITGEADHETVGAAAQARVTDYVLKPYSPDSLRIKITKALRPANIPRMPADAT